MTTTIEYVGKDQNWQDQSTTYWFETEIGKFGVVEGENSGIVDDEGYPISEDGQSHIIILTLCDSVTDEMRAL